MTFDNEYQEIPVTLKLDKNIAEVVRILAICYKGPGKEDIDNFISREVTQIVQSLAADPPEPPEFPDSFRQYIQDLLLSSSNEERRK